VQSRQPRERDVFTQRAPQGLEASQPGQQVAPDEKALAIRERLGGAGRGSTRSAEAIHQAGEHRRMKDALHGVAHTLVGSNAEQTHTARHRPGYQRASQRRRRRHVGVERQDPLGLAAQRALAVV
jgi:hypothetical protein